MSSSSISVGRVALILAVAGVLAGCVIHERERPVVTSTKEVIYVTQDPPATRSELVPPPPSSASVWQKGYWRWNGTQYDWVAGQYVERPRSSTT